MSAGTVEKPKTEVAQQPKPGGLSTVKGWLESPAFKDAIGKALPSHMKPDRFLRIAVTATMRTPKLLQCTQESLFGCLLALSQYGLEPDGRRAHLIPFENKRAGTTECTLIIDYKGLAELVMRSGLVSSIHADVVCEADEFAYDKGFILYHRIDFKKPRGEAYAAYAVIRFKDGTEKSEVMTKDEIYAIRNRGQGWQAFVKGWAKQSPWNPTEPVIEREMWKKTTFRRVSKWVPLSAEIRDAIESEDEAEERIRDIGPVDVVHSNGNGKSKSDDLAEMLAARMESQRDEAAHDEPPDNGEESQVIPDGEESQEAPAPIEADIAAKIGNAIKIASDESLLDKLEQESGLIKDDGLRGLLYAVIKARREALAALKGETPAKGKDKGGKLPMA